MAKRKTSTRTITNAGRLRVLEVVAATKAIGLAPTESSVEADGIIDLEFDKSVVRFEVQPVTLTDLQVDGASHKYTPDVRYIRTTGVIGYREFKHSGKPQEPELARKLAAAEARLTSEGYEFDVVESDQLRRGSRIANLRLLKRYAQWPLSGLQRDQVLKKLDEPGEHTLADLQEAVGLDSLGSLYRMLWDQEVGVELEGAPLGAESRVWRAQP